MIGEYEVIITLTDDETDQDRRRRMLVASTSFMVNIIEEGCAGNLNVPPDATFDTSLTAGLSKAQRIPLPNIDNGECQFSYEISSISGLTVAQEISVFGESIQDSLTLPTFSQDGQIYRVDQDGYLSVITQDLEGGIEI